MSKYNLKLKTAPTTEPFTVAEIKDYLKINDFNSCNGLTSLKCIEHATRIIGTVAGTSIDTTGYIPTIQLIVGTISTGGQLNVKIQESNDNINWTDWYSFTQITPDNDNNTYTYSYTGNKRYIRAISVLTIAGGDFSVNIILELGYTEEDIYISSLIKAARIFCEKHQSRAYITQTWQMFLTYFNNYCIEIPKGNLQTIDSISYKNSDGAINTLSENTDFVVSCNSILGKIVPSYGKSWPSFIPFPLDSVTIEFTCGYGDNSTDIPEDILLAMKLLISHWFHNRIPVDKALSNVKEVEFTLSSLLWNERIIIL